MVGDDGGTRPGPTPIRASGCFGKVSGVVMKNVRPLLRLVVWILEIEDWFTGQLHCHINDFRARGRGGRRVIGRRHTHIGRPGSTDPIQLVWCNAGMVKCLQYVTAVYRSIVDGCR